MCGLDTETRSEPAVWHEKGASVQEMWDSSDTDRRVVGRTRGVTGRSRRSGGSRRSSRRTWRRLHGLESRSALCQ